MTGEGFLMFKYNSFLQCLLFAQHIFHYMTEEMGMEGASELRVLYLLKIMQFETITQINMKMIHGSKFRIFLNFS